MQNIIPIPDLWEELEKLFRDGKIISHEYVFDELIPGDFLGKWIQDKQSSFFGISEKQIEITKKILKKFPSLIDSEKEKNQADPWVVALAIERMEEITLFSENTVVYVVSQEKISSTKRMPAVCNAFNVPHMNLDAFLKDNGLRFGIIK